MSIGKYKRWQGEPAFAATCTAPCIPALLRPQFTLITEGTVKAVERRIKCEEALRAEDQMIKERCDLARRQQGAQLQHRSKVIEKRSHRLAYAAALREERRLKAELHQPGRW